MAQEFRSNSDVTKKYQTVAQKLQTFVGNVTVDAAALHLMTMKYEKDTLVVACIEMDAPFHTDYTADELKTSIIVKARKLYPLDADFIRFITKGILDIATQVEEDEKNNRIALFQKTNALDAKFRAFVNFCIANNTKVELENNEIDQYLVAGDIALAYSTHVVFLGINDAFVEMNAFNDDMLVKKNVKMRFRMFDRDASLIIADKTDGEYIFTVGDERRGCSFVDRRMGYMANIGQCDMTQRLPKNTTEGQKKLWCDPATRFLVSNLPDNPKINPTAAYRSCNLFVNENLVVNNNLVVPILENANHN